MTADMEFNTVDGFQGREVDILLLSTVRASGSCSETLRVSSSNLGFISDVRRMNVALTRAKLSLWIFGNARTLQANKSWAALVEDAKQRNLIVSGRKPYSSVCKFGLENRPSFRNSSNIRSVEGEMVIATTECVNTQKKIVKHTFERKRQCTGTVLESACTGEDVSPSVKDAVKVDKKRATDGTNFSLTKEAASVLVPNSEKKVLKGAMLKLEENQMTKTVKSYVGKNDEKQINVVKSDAGKGNGNDNMRRHSVNSGKVRSRSQKHPSPIADEMCSKTIKHDKPPGVQITTSSSARSMREKCERGASNEVELHKDSIMKRKQQPEAIDALLPSALISSKKSDYSLVKSTGKRTLSTTKSSVHPVRPQKRRNG